MGNVVKSLLKAPSSFPQLLEQASGDTTKANALKMSVPNTNMPKSLLYTQTLVYLLRSAVLTAAFAKSWYQTEVCWGHVLHITHLCSVPSC